MKECLFQEKIIITKEQRTTDIEFEFEVKEDLEKLVISIEYGPKIMKDKELIQKEVKTCYQKYRKEEPFEMHECLMNFVSFSLERAGANIGTAHRHAQKKSYIISKGGSSPGFLKYKPKQGRYIICLHVNEIMTEEIIYDLLVEGIQAKTEEIVYVPLEMHTHTYHSDGDFSPRELYEAVRSYGYAGFAITDHNTMTSYECMPQNIEDEIFVMPGMECTTFWGHVLTLDANVNWRHAKRDTIDEFLEEVKNANGICGIAHPFELGAPISCGSNWEFDVSRWDLISYIELWSQNNPYSNRKNYLSREWYQQLLEEGKKLAITAGRDWHRADQERPSVLTATYVGIEGRKITKESVKEAIKQGRTYVTSLLELDISISAGGEKYGIGDTVEKQPIQVHIISKVASEEKIWASNDCIPKRVRIINNGQIVTDVVYSSDVLISDLYLERGYMIIEIVDEHPIAVTSAVYIA